MGGEGGGRANGDLCSQVNRPALRDGLCGARMLTQDVASLIFGPTSGRETEAAGYVGQRPTRQPDTTPATKTCRRGPRPGGQRYPQFVLRAHSLSWLRVLLRRLCTQFLQRFETRKRNFKSAHMIVAEIADADAQVVLAGGRRFDGLTRQ